jgi:diguanylate cyclase (GGDEF)-like protein
VPTRILLLGPIPPETLAALEALPGGVTILPPAETHSLLTRVTTEQPDMIVEGTHGVDWAGSSNALYRVLEGEFSRAVRYRHPLSLIVVAVDGPEVMEATHGADALERFQTTLAEALRRSLRRIDLLASIGSGEFAVVLPETSASGARIVAERARAVASRLLVKSDHDRRALPVKGTVSIGVADAPREGLANADDLLAAARRALALASENGGDRVETV